MRPLLAASTRATDGRACIHRSRSPRLCPDRIGAAGTAGALRARRGKPRGGFAAARRCVRSRVARSAREANSRATVPRLAATFSHAPSVAVTRHLWRVLDSAWRAPPAPMRRSPSPCSRCRSWSCRASKARRRPLALRRARASGAPRGDPARARRDEGQPHASRSPMPSSRRRRSTLRGCRRFAQWQTSCPTRSRRARCRAAETWSRRRSPFPQAAKRSICAFFSAPRSQAPAADLLAEPDVGRWGIPFAQQLARELATDGVSVLVLPRAPQRLLPAVAAGRAAQREVSAQLFASNAIRTIPQLGRRTLGGDQRASRAGRARRRRAAPVAVVAVRSSRRRGVSLPALSARSSRRRRDDAGRAARGIAG